MSKTAHKLGDLVQLKGGGPRLTVIEVRVIPKDEWHPTERVRVQFQWFSEDGTLHTDETYPEALKPAQRKGKEKPCQP